MGYFTLPLKGSTSNGFKFSYISVIYAVSYVLLSAPEVAARGRLMEPAQRSSLWTRGFDSPRNNDDTGLNCGGAWVQHGNNDGKCGVCGDRYDSLPRDNEPGGKYANGIIANTYTTNDSSILVVVDVQSFLGGFFEFRICPNNNVHMSVQQECLNRHQLRVWDLQNKEPRFRYYPQSPGLQRLRVEIPRGMTCTQCVFQWKWHTAKDWGICDDGTQGVGCGPQEEYYNCADIAIEPVTTYNENIAMDTPLPSEIPTTVQEMTLQPLENTNQVVMGQPISFLPTDILQAGNVGPVIPKFDFFDPSAMVMDPTAIPATIVNIPTNVVRSKKNAVVLQFNGGESQTTTTTSGSASSAAPVQAAAVTPTAEIPTSSVSQITTGSGTTDTVNTGTVSQTNVLDVTTGSAAASVTPTEGAPLTTTMVQAASTSSADPSTTTTSGEQSTTTNTMTTTPEAAQTTTETRKLAPLPSVARMSDIPAERMKKQIPTLTRHRRQAPGPKIPPPPPPVDQKTASSSQTSSSYSSSVTHNAPVAPVKTQQTIYFGNLIGDSFNRGQSGSRTEKSFMTAADFQSSSTSQVVGEALGEPGIAVGVTADTRYQPEVVRTPAIQSAGTAFKLGGTMVDTLFEMPGQTVMAAGLDIPAGSGMDTSMGQTVLGDNPSIPRPPKQSAAEMEASRSAPSVITSVMSDTGIQLDPSALVGASYIPELNEGRSNQAETSTAARHGTMIISGENKVMAPSGASQEYLAPSQGTSLVDNRVNTQAEVRSATLHLNRFGYQPTAEQLLSETSGITHSTQSLDTTNLETTGPDPNAASVVPGIFSSILGGGSNTVTDAQLDPSIQKSREDLIRQLGEAMGVIGPASATAFRLTAPSTGNVATSNTAEATSLSSTATTLQTKPSDTTAVVSQQEIVKPEPANVNMVGSQQAIVDTSVYPTVTGTSGNVAVADVTSTGNIQVVDGLDYASTGNTVSNAQTEITGTGSVTQPGATGTETYGMLPGMTIDQMMSVLNMGQNALMNDMGQASGTSGSSSTSATSTSASSVTDTAANNNAAVLTGNAVDTSMQTTGNALDFLGGMTMEQMMNAFNGGQSSQIMGVDSSASGQVSTSSDLTSTTTGQNNAASSQTSRTSGQTSSTSSQTAETVPIYQPMPETPLQNQPQEPTTSYVDAATQTTNYQDASSNQYTGQNSQYGSTVSDTLYTGTQTNVATDFNSVAGKATGLDSQVYDTPAANSQQAIPSKPTDPQVVLNSNFVDTTSQTGFNPALFDQGMINQFIGLQGSGGNFGNIAMAEVTAPGTERTPATSSNAASTNNNAQSNAETATTTTSNAYTGLNVGAASNTVTSGGDFPTGAYDQTQTQGMTAGVPTGTGMGDTMIGNLGRTNPMFGLFDMGMGGFNQNQASPYGPEMFDMAMVGNQAGMQSTGINTNVQTSNTGLQGTNLTPVINEAAIVQTVQNRAAEAELNAIANMERMANNMGSSSAASSFSTPSAASTVTGNTQVATGSQGTYASSTGSQAATEVTGQSSFSSGSQTITNNLQDSTYAAANVVVDTPSQTASTVTKADASTQTGIDMTSVDTGISQTNPAIDSTQFATGTQTETGFPMIDPTPKPQAANYQPNMYDTTGSMTNQVDSYANTVAAASPDTYSATAGSQTNAITSNTGATITSQVDNYAQATSGAAVQTDVFGNAITSNTGATSTSQVDNYGQATSGAAVQTDVFGNAINSNTGATSTSQVDNYAQAAPGVVNEVDMFGNALTSNTGLTSPPQVDNYAQAASGAGNQVDAFGNVVTTNTGATATGQVDTFGQTQTTSTGTGNTAQVDAFGNIGGAATVQFDAFGYPINTGTSGVTAAQVDMFGQPITTPSVSGNTAQSNVYSQTFSTNGQNVGQTDTTNNVATSTSISSATGQSASQTSAVAQPTQDVSMRSTTTSQYDGMISLADIFGGRLMPNTAVGTGGMAEQTQMDASQSAAQTNQAASAATATQTNQAATQTATTQVDSGFTPVGGLGDGATWGQRAQAPQPEYGWVWSENQWQWLPVQSTQQQQTAVATTVVANQQTANAGSGIKVTDTVAFSTSIVDPAPTKATKQVPAVTSKPIPTTTEIPYVYKPSPEEKARSERLQRELDMQKEELLRLRHQSKEHERQLKLEQQRIEFERQQMVVRRQQIKLEQERKTKEIKRMQLEEQNRLLELEQKKMLEALYATTTVTPTTPAPVTYQSNVQQPIVTGQTSTGIAQSQQLGGKYPQNNNAAVSMSAQSVVASAGQTGQVVGQAAYTGEAAPTGASFTPIGGVGYGGTSQNADAATVEAWQSVIRAAQAQVPGAVAQPAAYPGVVPPMQAMPGAMQAMPGVVPGMQAMPATPQVLNPGWGAYMQQSNPAAMMPQMPVQNAMGWNQWGVTPAPPVVSQIQPMVGTWPNTGVAQPQVPGVNNMNNMALLLQLLQQQQAAAAKTTTTTPKPTTTTTQKPTPAPIKKRIRPDRATRDFVRKTFINNMGPGIDPISILVGFTPETLMKAGVNPMIANSGDITQIIPAVERTLGISLQKPAASAVSLSPSGRSRQRPIPGSGGSAGNTAGGPPGQPGSAERRRHMLEQRMMQEMMQMMGIGPEPLEAGDPGYTGPGATGAAAGTGPASRRGRVHPGRGHPGRPGVPPPVRGGGGGGAAAQPFEMTDAQQIAIEQRMNRRRQRGGRRGGGPPAGPGYGSGAPAGPARQQPTLAEQMELLGL